MCIRDSLWGLMRPPWLGLHCALTGIPVFSNNRTLCGSPLCGNSIPMLGLSLVSWIVICGLHPTE
eukprot:859017-Alexandrium_andersonii.AAC.1